MLKYIKAVEDNRDKLSAAIQSERDRKAVLESQTAEHKASETKFKKGPQGGSRARQRAVAIMYELPTRPPCAVPRAPVLMIHSSPWQATFAPRLSRVALRSLRGPRRSMPDCALLALPAGLEFLDNGFPDLLDDVTDFQARNAEACHERACR